MFRKLLIVLACIIPTIVIADNAYVDISVGSIGVGDSTKQTTWGVSYSFGPILEFDIIPTVGVSVNAEHSKYAYTEVKHNFYINPSLILIPSFGVALFDTDHDIDLGNIFEFRSGLELSHRFQNNYRLGVAVHHLSNAGTASHNPGTNSLIMTFSIPIEK